MAQFSIDEEWRVIEKWPNYMVSDQARVKSLARTVPCGRVAGSVRQISETLLNPFICKQTGYHQVVFQRKKQNVHRLVALAFLGKPRPGLQVNHKNGIRADSKLSNLEWVTPSENIRHGFTHNGNVAHNKGKFGVASTSAMAVVATNIKTGEKLHFAAGMDAVRTGLFRSDGISRACSGQIASHAGYRWESAQ